jgi:chemotaxis protein MotA
MTIGGHEATPRNERRDSGCRGKIRPGHGHDRDPRGPREHAFAMDDPKSIGPAMAVALLTTMYGAILANMIFGPMSEKIKDYSAREATNCALIIEGIMFIQSGGNPRLDG